MATYYLIRHGEADFNGLMERGFYGFGRAFAPLTEKGRMQVEQTAKDERLKRASFIVSSPYTRALQTAQIISKHTGLEVVIDLDLHEWIPDLTNQVKSAEEADVLYKEFMRCKGEYPQGETRRWETVSSVRNRMKKVADKYVKNDCVILVGHGMAFRTLSYMEKLKPAEIFECHYEMNHEACEFVFDKY